MVKGWSAEQRQTLRDDVPKLGFKAEIGNRNVLTLAQETLRLASRGLARRARLDRNGRDETRYLRPLEESIARGITPAEELLEKFHGEWNGSVDPIYESMRINVCPAAQCGPPYRSLSGTIGSLHSGRS